MRMDFACSGFAPQEQADRHSKQSNLTVAFGFVT